MKLKERLKAVEADITKLSLDAIVNAANASLTPGGGVDGAIRFAAGPALNAELTKIAVCAPGTAIITPGYRLRAKHVIHAVAPIWGRGIKRLEQEEILASCYESVFRLADSHEIATIAFPAIGTGHYGWPANLAAEIAFDAAVEHLLEGGRQQTILFCCYTRADFELYSAHINRLKS